MSSLRAIIEQGRYELAAYRLICGAVQAHVEQRQEQGAFEPSRRVGRSRPQVHVVKRRSS
jgi:hypothetical protein